MRLQIAVDLIDLVKHLFHFMQCPRILSACTLWFAQPFFKPVTVVFLSPEGVGIHDLCAAIFWKQQSHGIHFLKQAAQFFFRIILLTVPMCDEILLEVFLSGLSPFIGSAATAKVFHKIDQDGFGGSFYEPAQKQERIRQGEVKSWVASVSAGLPFEFGFEFAELFEAVGGGGNFFHDKRFW
jgi:hypothetical protein